MALGSSVPTAGDEVVQADGLYGWDWSATTHDAHDGVVNELVESMHKQCGGVVVLPGKGLQGWPLSVQAFDRRGDKLASVYYGGGRDDVHVLATSEAADRVRRIVAPGSKTARVDTRVDTLVPFDELEDLCRRAGQSYNVRLTRMESWEGNGDSLGRTIYLGAPTSAIRVRVYEKWLESPGQYVEGTNRVEVQLRPPSRVKAHVSEWGPSSTFCASRVTRELARLLGTDIADPGSLHVAKPTPTLEQSLEAMGKQYGNRFAEWLAVSGGDAFKVLEYLEARGPLDQSA